MRSGGASSNGVTQPKTKKANWEIAIEGTITRSKAREFHRRLKKHARRPSRKTEPIPAITAAKATNGSVSVECGAVKPIVTIFVRVKIMNAMQKYLRMGGIESVNRNFLIR